jgi:hypothetical protein
MRRVRPGGDGQGFAAGQILDSGPERPPARNLYKAWNRPGNVLPIVPKKSNGSNGSAPSGALREIGGFYRQ